MDSSADELCVSPLNIIEEMIWGDFVLLFLQEQMLADDLGSEVGCVTCRCNRTGE